MSSSDEVTTGKLIKIDTDDLTIKEFLLNSLENGELKDIDDWEKNHIKEENYNEKNSYSIDDTFYVYRNEVIFKIINLKTIQDESHINKISESEIDFYLSYFNGGSSWDEELSGVMDGEFELK